MFLSSSSTSHNYSYYSIILNRQLLAVNPNFDIETHSDAKSFKIAYYITWISFSDHTNNIAYWPCIILLN
jgi:hypothetical protein